MVSDFWFRLCQTSCWHQNWSLVRGSCAITELLFWCQQEVWHNLNCHPVHYVTRHASDPSFYSSKALHFFQQPNFFLKIVLPSASTSLIMSWSSASVGFWPSDLMTVPNSFVVMVPSPSLSNSEKASLNSAICSSVSWSALSMNKRSG